ncbi:MAG: lysophospholipid acyltransferase family protein [Gammaproteobacteria bacterium]
MYAWIGRLTAPGIFARAVRRVLAALPRGVVYPLLTLVGWCIYACATRTRRRIQQNMAILLPETAPRERSRLGRRYVVHECMTIYEQAIEYRHALSTTSRRRARIELDGVEQLDAALRLGRGAILYTPHLGNYFYSYWRLSQQYDATTVVTAGSAELRKLFEEVYALGGMKGYDYDTETPRDLVFKLRAHLKRNGVVFLLSDFSRPEFPPYTLFGKPARLPSGALTLALLQQCPIVPCYGERTGWGKHRLVFLPPLHLHERYDMRHKSEAMQQLAHTMENLIREVPEQWLYWFNVHERWEAPPAATVATAASSSAEGAH